MTKDAKMQKSRYRTIPARSFRIVLGCAALWLAGITGATEPPSMPSYLPVEVFREDADLNAVAMSDARIGLAVGDLGAMLRTEDGGQTWSAVPALVDCRLEHCIWRSSRQAFAVGGGHDPLTGLSRGVVLRSDDGGKTFASVSTDALPYLRHVSIGGDGSVRVRGDRCHWAGSEHLVSSDGGATWAGMSGDRLMGSAETATRERATRVEAGDARITVGRGGWITRSVADATPVVVRGGDHPPRPAVLVITADAASAPWPLIGREAIESNLRVRVLLTSATPADVPPARTAALSIGATGLDALDAPAIDFRPDSAAAINRIRTRVLALRPSVIAIDKTLGPRFAAAIAEFAPSCGVVRLVQFSKARDQSPTLHRDAWLRRCGQVASDLSIDALLIAAPLMAEASHWRVLPIWERAPSRARRSGEANRLTDGIDVPSSARRPRAAVVASQRDLQVVQGRLMQSRRGIDRVLGRRDPASVRDDFAAILQQTLPPDRFRLAMTIYQTAVRRSAPPRTRSAILAEIADRFGETSAGRWAALRRDALEHTTPWRRQRERAFSTQSDDDSMVRQAAVSPFQIDRSAVVPASILVPNGSLIPGRATRRSDRTKKRSSDHAVVDLQWDFHPAVLMARAALRHRMEVAASEHPGAEALADGDGESNAASSRLDRLADEASGPWSLLAGGRGQTLARRAARRPVLDASFEDPCWTDEGSDRVRWDDDYLYFAIRVPHAEFDGDSERSDVVTRDEDLDEVDRVRIAIDVDRSTLASTRLEVSATGRTRDTIDGDPLADPTWYVDVRRDGDEVRFEIAVARRDLSDRPIRVGDRWLIAIEILRAGQVDSIRPIIRPKAWRSVLFTD